MSISQEKFKQMLKEKGRVKKVFVDKSSGLIFDKEHCRDRNREERYYIMGTEPKKKCDKFHLF